MNEHFEDACKTMLNDLAMMPPGSFRKYWPAMMLQLDYTVHKEQEVCLLLYCSCIRSSNSVLKACSASTHLIMLQPAPIDVELQSSLTDEQAEEMVQDQAEQRIVTLER